MSLSTTNPGNVHVVIRVRPLATSGDSDDDPPSVHWKVKGNQIYETGGQDDGFSRPASKPYVFDRIFDSNSTTEQVFNEVALPILSAVMEGYNGTIFAYGQTSSGKTHTMMGNKRNEGLIPRMFRALFECIQRTPTRDFLLRVSCLEIHNEKIYDLLSLTKKALNLRENSSGQPFVEDLKCVFVNNFHHLMETMWQCEGNRSYGATAMNECSSRSHTVFSLIVESSHPQVNSCDAIEGAVRVSHLNLVDLAGSERTGQMGTTGSHFKEGCLINASLFALRNVIYKLTQSDNQFINFRDSKLTRILKASLGGNAKTSIVCTVTPDQIEETHSTLKFASTAKTMENKPEVNEILSEEAGMKQNARQLQVLLKEREALKKKEKDQAQMERELEQSNKKNLELEAKILSLKKRIIHSRNSGVVNMSHRNRRETWAGGLKMGSDDSPPCSDIPFDPFAKWQDAVFAKDDLDIEPFPKCWRSDRIKSAPMELNLVSSNHSDVECQTDESGIRSEDEVIANLKWRGSNLQRELKRSESLVASLTTDVNEQKEFNRHESLIIKELEANLEEMNAKMHSYEKTTRDAESLYLESNRKCSILVDDCERLLAQVAELESANNNASGQEAQTAITTSANKQLKKELMSSMKRVIELENTQKDHDVLFDLQNQRHEKLVQELRGQLQDAYKQMEKLNVNTGNEDKDDEKIRNIQASEKDLKVLVESMKQEMEISAAELEKLRCEANEKSVASAARIEQLQAELRHSNCNATEMTNTIADMKSRFGELETALDQANRKSAHLVQEMSGFEELARKLSEREATNEQLLVKIALLETDSNLNQLRAVNDRNEELLRDSMDMSIKLQEQRDQMVIQKSEIEAISKENSQLKMKCAELAASVKMVSKSKIDELSAIYARDSSNEDRSTAENNNELTTLNNDRFPLLTEINCLFKSQLVCQAALLHENNSSKSDEAQSPIEDSEVAEDEKRFKVDGMSELQEQMEKLRVENVELHQELQTLKLQCADHLVHIADLESKNLTNEADDVEADILADFVEKLDVLSRQLNEQRQLCKKLESENMNNVTVNKRLNAVVKKSREQSLEYQTIIHNEVRSRETELKVLREQLEAKVAFAEMRSGEFEDIIRFLEADKLIEAAEFERKVEELQRKEAKLKKNVHELQTTIEMGCTHEAEMLIVQQEFEVREENLKRELQRLREELASVSNERSHLVVAAGDSSLRSCSMCQKLLQTNTTLNQEILKFEKELLDLKVKFDKDLLDLKAERTRLLDILDDSNNDVDKYKTCCDDYHREVEELSAELSSLRKQLDQVDEMRNSTTDGQLEKLQADNNRLRNEISTRIKEGLKESGRNDADKRKLQSDVKALEGLNKVLEKKNVCLKNDLRRMQLERMDTTILGAPSNAQGSQETPRFPNEDLQKGGVCKSCGSVIASSSSQGLDARIEGNEFVTQRKMHTLASRAKQIQSPKKSSKPSNVKAVCDNENVQGSSSSKENVPVDEEKCSSPKKFKGLSVAPARKPLKHGEILQPTITMQDNSLNEEISEDIKASCKVN